MTTAHAEPTSGAAGRRAAAFGAYVTLTRFDSKDARKKGRHSYTPWSEVVRMFREPLPWPGDKTLAPLWSGTTFDDDSRAAADKRNDVPAQKPPHWPALSCSLLVLDYDDDPEMSLERIEACWGSWRYVAGTTSSHLRQKDAKPALPRFRVALPLPEDITPEKLHQLGRWARHPRRGAGILGNECEQPCRCFFVPTKRDENYEWAEHEGPLLDVEEALRELAEWDLEEAEPEPPPRQESQHRADGQNDREQRYVQSALDGECAKIRGAALHAEHGRSRASARAVGGFVGRGGLTLDAARQALLAAALDTRKGTTAKGRRDVERAIDWGLAKGMEEPREIPASVYEAQPDNGVEPPGEAPPHDDAPPPTDEDLGVARNLLDFNFTDAGNAERFEHVEGERFRYVHAWASWLGWTGKRWERGSDGAAQLAMLRVMRSLGEEVGALPETDARRKAGEKHAKSSENAGKLDAGLGLAQAFLPVAVSSLDADPCLLNVENGMLELGELGTGRFAPHDPSPMLTMLAPVKYDPDAKCPQWEAFLEKVMGGNQSLISFLQRAVGYSLTGETREQCFFLLHGTGRNGKSTFIETVRAMLGDYAQATPFETFLRQDNDRVRNDLARLRGARFVSAVEPDPGRALAESVIKQVTGGDTITARFLFGEFFDFRPQFKLWLATNTLPRVVGTDLGIWRRVLRVPFEVTIPEGEQDRELLAKLLEELPGILAWAMVGLEDWRRRGSLAVPEAVRTATSKYQSEQDHFGEFVRQELAEDKAEQAPIRVLFDKYVAWCQQEGERVRSKKAMGAWLSLKGFKPGKGGGERTWLGLRLKTEEEKKKEAGKEEADKSSDERGEVCP